NQALADLYTTLKTHKMEYIIDVSINHSGSGHHWLQDKTSQNYYLQNSKGEYSPWEGVSTLLTLDYASLDLKEKMYFAEDSILKKWMQAPYFCKGYRFDVGHSLARNLKYFDHYKIWSEIRQSIKSVQEDALILTEYWAEASNYLQGDLWDSSTNYYGFLLPIRKYFGINLDQRNKKRYFQNTALLVHSLKQAYKEIPFSQALIQCNMLATHDISRLYHHKNVSKEQYFGLLCLLFTYIGVPCLYYGDEILLSGKILHNEDYRYPMNWQSKNFQSALHLKLKQLISHRKSKEVLQKGSLLFLDVPNGMISFVRKLKGKFYLVVLNFTKYKQVIELDMPFILAGEIHQLQSIFDETKSFEITAQTRFTIEPSHSDVYSNCI
ncbi:alpha-amylase family glycosyl hydrolase, partial [bacterium]|nr:alpha-amylase family glycosyl hydrolase [bacterium]